MLNKKQIATIRHINVLEYAEHEKDGKPINFIDEEFLIPSFIELKNFALKLIKAKGFTEIQRVAPAEANCIIRVFKKTHYQYDDEYTINAYGFCCFTQKNDTWITFDAYDSESEIDYSEHQINIWLCKDESIVMSANFFDIYVQIS